MPSLTADISIAMPGTDNAGQVKVAPGSAHVFAVATSGGGGLTSGVAVYDDGVARANVYVGTAYPASSSATTLSWGANANTLYALATDSHDLNTLTVAAAGVQSAVVDPGTSLGGSITFKSGLLYSGSGGVFDPVNHVEKPTLADSSFYQSVAVDAAAGTAFFPVYAPEEAIVRVPLADPARRARLLLPNANLANSQPVRWGTRGLAFSDYNGALYIVEGSFIGP